MFLRPPVYTFRIRHLRPWNSSIKFGYSILVVHRTAWSGFGSPQLCAWSLSLNLYPQTRRHKVMVCQRRNNLTIILFRLELKKFRKLTALPYSAISSSR